MSGQAAGAVQWYAMLFPARRGAHTVVQEMAALVGGTANPEQHVTIGYYTPTEADADLAAPLRALHGPTVTVKASTPFNGLWRPDAPDVARNLLLRVEPTPELRWWHAAVNDALTPLAMPTWPVWDDVRLHMHVVMEPAMDPPEALALLGQRPWVVAFEATRLVVSRRSGDTITVVLDQPLNGGVG